MRRLTQILLDKKWAAKKSIAINEMKHFNAKLFLK